MLTTGTDTFVGTSGNDTFTATDKTLNSADVISDVSTTDKDVMNVTVTDAVGDLSATTATISNVETINYAFKSFAAPIIDASNIKSGTINFTQTQTGGAQTAQVNKAGNVTIVAGSGVTGQVTVTQGDGVTTTVTSQGAVSVTANNAAGTNANTMTVTAGKDKAITLGGTAATTDTATVSGSGTSNLTTNSGAAVEAVTLKGNAADVTFDVQNALTGAAVTLAGDKSITVKASSAEATGIAFTDSTTAGTTTLKIDATTDGNDLTKAAVDRINVNVVTGAGDDLIFASGSTVEVSATANRLDLIATKAGSTDTTDSITIIGSGATTVIGNATVGAGATKDGFETVNYSSAYTAGANTLTATLGATATLNISGANDVTVANTSTSKALNASTLTGKLTATANTNNASVTGGTGNDTITVANKATVDTGAGDDGITSTVGGDVGTITAGAGDDTVTLIAGDTGTVTGGDGTDTLNLAGASAANFSGFEVVSVTAATGVKVSALHDVALNLKGDTLAFAASDVSTINLSKLTVDPAMTSITFGSGLDGAKFGSATGFTFTGTSIKDIVTGTANADTIDGGAGADEISAGAGNDTITAGEGADAITGGAGADTINLVEVTAARDTLTFATTDSTGTITGTGDAGAIAGYDVVTGFYVGTTAAAKDQLDLVGTAVLAADTASTTGTASTLTIGGATVKSHKISTGVISFDDVATFAEALTIDSNAKIAAVVDYLKGTDLGTGGETVAFKATVDGVAHTFVYSQEADAVGAYTLVDLVGVTVNALETAASATSGNIFIA